MLKKSLIAAATAVVLAGSAFATATGATAASASSIEISTKGGWSGHGQWNGHDNWKGHSSGKHGGHKKWKPRQACQPIIRWKKVGYRYHRRWQPIVVGWNCHGKYGGHKNGKWH